MDELRKRVTEGIDDIVSGKRKPGDVTRELVESVSKKKTITVEVPGWLEDILNKDSIDSSLMEFVKRYRQEPDHSKGEYNADETIQFMEIYFYNIAERVKKHYKEKFDERRFKDKCLRRWKRNMLAFNFIDIIIEEVKKEML